MSDSWGEVFEQNNVELDVLEARLSAAPKQYQAVGFL